MNGSKRFEGQVAVVTGGAAGIGYAAAARLHAEGARISIWDLDPKGLDRAKHSLGGSAHGVALDVADADAVSRAADETAAALGRIDVLVASAGIAGPTKPLWECPPAEWRRVIDTNLHGVFYSNRAVVPHMLRNDYGRIVNIASIAGKEGNPNASPYSASKAAVIGLTKSLGKELAKTGIRVNCVTPAAVRTAIFDQITQEHLDCIL